VLSIAYVKMLCQLDIYYKLLYNTDVIMNRQHIQDRIIFYIAYIGGNITGTVQGLYIVCREKLKTYIKFLQEWVYGL
jgi:hypothetical protein